MLHDWWDLLLLGDSTQFALFLQFPYDSLIIWETNLEMLFSRWTWNTLAELCLTQRASFTLIVLLEQIHTLLW